jgi:hypothetical protein
MRNRKHQIMTVNDDVLRQQNVSSKKHTNYGGKTTPGHYIKGPFGTAPAPDSKRGSGGAVPNGYFFKLILVWSRKIGSRFCEERWDLKKTCSTLP